MRLLIEDYSDEEIYLGEITVSFKNWDIEDGTGSLYLNSDGTFTIDDNVSGRETFNTINECKEYIKDFYEPDGEIDTISIEWEYPGLSRILASKSKTSIYNRISNYIEEQERIRYNKRKEADKAVETKRALASKALDKFFNSLRSKDELEKLLVDKRVITLTNSDTIWFCDYNLQSLVEDAPYYINDNEAIDKIIKFLGIEKADLEEDSDYLRSVYDKYYTGDPKYKWTMYPWRNGGK